MSNKTKGNNVEETQTKDSSTVETPPTKDSSTVETPTKDSSTVETPPTKNSSMVETPTSNILARINNADMKNRLVNTFLQGEGISNRGNAGEVYYYDGEFVGITEEFLVANEKFSNFILAHEADVANEKLGVDYKKAVLHLINLHTGIKFTDFSILVVLYSGKPSSTIGSLVLKYLTDVYYTTLESGEDISSDFFVGILDYTGKVTEKYLKELTGEV